METKRIDSKCDLTHANVRHDASMYATWLVRYVRRDSFIHDTRLIHACDMTHLYMRHDSFIHDTRLTACDMTHLYMWHDSFILDASIYATWLVHTWYTTQSCVRHDASIYATWLVHIWYTSHSDLSVHVAAAQVEWKQSISTSRSQSCDPSIGICDVTHSYVRHDSLIRETWLIYIHDMTHLRVWHDSNIRVTWLIHTCAMNHSYVRHHTIIRASLF